MANIRIKDLPTEATPASTDVIPLDQATTRKATLATVFDTIRPFADQTEAEAGTNETKAMNPKRVSQAIAALGATQFASAAQGTTADTALQPGDIGSSVQGYDALLESVSGLTIASQDLIVGSGSNTVAKLGKGTDGQVLSVASGSVAWADPNFAPADDSVSTAKIVDGAVTTAKLADNSVTNAKLTAAHSLALSHTVADRTDLKALDTARYNVAFVQGLSGGLFVWSSSDLSTEVTADAEEGVYVAPTADATGASGAWVRVIDNAINVKWYGAVGDGATDDTTAIQAALDTGLNIYIPETENGFLVSTLDLLNNQEIRGAGKWKKGLVGDGTGPVLQIGDGTGSIRSNVISRLKIENTGAECINGDFAPNLTIEGCEIRCSGAHAINLKLCYRLIVQDNYILTSGAYTALRALNNCNGGVFFKNTITGGSAGRAIQIGQSQGIRVDNNIIETSLDGIWIASTNDTDDGNCNGVTLINNYMEQCSTPFVLSKVYTIFGLTMESNYVGNAATTTIATRVACVQHGRIKGGSITDNAFYLDSGGSEDLLHVYLPLTSANIVDMEWQRNYVENAATNLTKLGTYGSNGGANNDVGANSYYDFGDGELPNKRVFISPTLKADVITGDIEWTDIGEYNWGGEIESVEIIDAVGSLTGCNVALGDSMNFQANVSQVDISTLTFTRGKTDLTVAGNSIDTRASGYNRYKVIAGTGTGSFRIKITYRAN